MPKNIYQSLYLFLEKKFIILPLLTILYWAAFQFYTSDSTKEFHGFIFGILIVILASVSAFFSLLRSYEWEFTKSYIGKSLFFFFLGLLMWVIGQSIFVLSTVNPLLEGFYDAFFPFIDVFYLIGVFYLAKSINTFKEVFLQLKIFLIPIFVFFGNIFIISQIRSEQVSEYISNFDINLIYILGSIVVASSVISILIISGKKIGGKFKAALYLILIGILFQYLGDNLFELSEIFQENGSAADLVFFLSIFFIFYGVLKLNPRSLK